MGNTFQLKENNENGWAQRDAKRQDGKSAILLLLYGDSHHFTCVGTL